MFNVLLDKDASDAYKLAQKIKDEALIQEARERILKDYTTYAAILNFTEHNDKAGMDIIIGQLTQKYGTDRKTLDPLLAKFAEKHKGDL
jgi:hypothetical protein